MTWRRCSSRDYYASTGAAVKHWHWIAIKHQERTDGLVHTLHEVLVAWGTDGNAEERLQAIGTVLVPDSRVLLEQCEAHQAQSGNYYPYMWRLYQGHRATLIRIWRALNFRSTTHDTSLRRS